jgi:hypothetical protein
MVISSMVPVTFCLSSSSTMKPPMFPAPMIAKLLKLDIMLVGEWMKRVLGTLVGRSKWVGDIYPASRDAK